MEVAPRSAIGDRGSASDWTAESEDARKSALAEIAGASEARFLALLSGASRGDPVAQRELVRLRLAYLNWAYAGQGARQRPAHPSLS